LFPREAKIPLMLQSFEFVRIMQRKDLSNNSTGDTPWNLKTNNISM